MCLCEFKLQIIFEWLQQQQHSFLLLIFHSFFSSFRCLLELCFFVSVITWKWVGWTFLRLTHYTFSHFSKFSLNEWVLFFFFFVVWHHHIPIPFRNLTIFIDTRLKIKTNPTKIRIFIRRLLLIYYHQAAVRFSFHFHITSPSLQCKSWKHFNFFSSSRFYFTSSL